jgi:glycosyltransferase involved in cell wall biosynthesis
MLTFCTLVAGDSAAAAEAMAASVRAHEPGARLIASPRYAALGAATWDELLAAGDAPTPAELLRHALERSDTAVYVAPEVRLYSPLAPVWDALADHAVALFARVGTLPDDGELPDDAALRQAGRISTSCVAVSRGPAAQEFLDWWSHRLAGATPSSGRNPGSGPHTAHEPCWLDLASERFPSVVKVSDPGCNVSYWNLHERRLEGALDSPLVDGRPLRFIDFAGFRADRPYWLSEAGTRVSVMDNPLLSQLCGAHAEELRAAGWAPPRRAISDLQRLGNSQRVDHLVRALWDQALEEGVDFGDPLRAVNADAFVAWMCGPAERGGEAGVNRYLYAAYATRPDLRAAYPDLDGAGGPGLIRWAWDHGRREVLSELLPPVSGSSRGTGISVNVVGFLGETMGLGEVARLYALGLAAAGVPVATTTIRPDAPAAAEPDAIRRSGSFAYPELTSEVEPAFNLACLNADSLAKFLHEGGQSVLDARPTIGQWNWETDVLPAGWAAAAEMLGEIWVCSRFVAENLARLVAVPVVVVPPPIVAARPAAEPPITFDDRFTFVFMFDFFSTLQRKNPLGLIDAFSAAFAPGDGARLVIKTMNGEHRTTAAELLQSAAAGHPDIELIDGYLTDAAKAALIARADCYVSLHRSEGFGLTIAEAMTLGTPVITTAYSGNMDFTTAHNSFLVDWRPTGVGPDCEVYPAHGHWADPDLYDAAVQMRSVRRHPEAAALRSLRARRDIATAYEPKVVGEIARGRLELLSDRWGARSGEVRPAMGRSWALIRRMGAVRRARLRRP